MIFRGIADAAIAGRLGTDFGDEAQTLMTNYLELPVGEKSPEVINVVIEIPLEGINKYEYDKKLHVFRLDRNLYSPVHYPGDYGFVPEHAGRTATRWTAGAGGCAELLRMRAGGAADRACWR